MRAVPAILSLTRYLHAHLGLLLLAEKGLIVRHLCGVRGLLILIIRLSLVRLRSLCGLHRKVLLVLACCHCLLRSWILERSLVRSLDILAHLQRTVQALPLPVRRTIATFVLPVRVHGKQRRATHTSCLHPALG